ncbi:MAG: hypothetical protein ACFE95_13655 [Candidatus Hodarchaeota archaeon]
MVNYSSKKKAIFIFFFVILVIRPVFFSEKEMSIDKNVSQRRISPVLASGKLSSYNPTAIRSSSGIIHLLFYHEVQEYDMIGRDIYHTFELEDGTWSVPQKVFLGGYYIFDIRMTEGGFVVYYYNERIAKRGPCKREYDEQTNRWSTEILLFGKIQMVDYLNLSVDESEDFLWWFHAFRVEEDGTYLVVWGFEFWRESNFTHEYESHYLVSRVSSNMSIDTQPILGLTPEYSPSSLTFIPIENSLFLYSHVFHERARLHPNGSWSEWETTGFLERYTYWDSFLVLDRYLLWHGVNGNGPQSTEIWGLIDLAAETLSMRNFNLPHWSHFDYRLDVEGVLDTQDEIVFELGLISNQSIELWEYGSQADNWTQMAAYHHNFDFKINYFYYMFDFDLLRVEEEWHLFWDQSLSESELPYEIFTLSYNEDTENWGSIRQITDTNVIRDDFTGNNLGSLFYYIPEHVIFGVLLLGGLGALIALILFYQKRKTR